MNDNKFPVLRKDYILRQYQVENEKKAIIYGLYNEKKVELNDDSLAVIELLTGQYSMAQAAALISEKYQIPYLEAKNSIEPIMADLVERDIVYFVDQSETLRYFPILKKMRGALDSLYIRLTNGCNLNCLHCSVNARERLPGELPASRFYDIIDQVHDMMIPTVSFTGGEPTLFEELPQLINYCFNKPLKVILMTNGLNITKTYAEMLARNGLSRVNISIDGAQEKTHDSFRRTPGSFKKALAAIEIFRELGVLVETTTVVHEGNYTEVESILEYEKKYELLTMKFMPIIPAERGLYCDYERSLAVYVNDTITKILPIIEKWKFFKKDLLGKISKERVLRCNAGTGVLSIKSNGDVLPCNNFDTIVLGNLKDRSLYDIYMNSEIIGELHKAIQIQGTECETCKLLEYCHGGCPMISLSYNGVFGGCDATRKAEIVAVLDKKQMKL